MTRKQGFMSMRSITFNGVSYSCRSATATFCRLPLHSGVWRDKIINQTLYSTSGDFLKKELYFFKFCNPHFAKCIFYVLHYLCLRKSKYIVMKDGLLFLRTIVQVTRLLWHRGIELETRYTQKFFVKSTLLQAPPASKRTGFV